MTISAPNAHPIVICEKKQQTQSQGVHGHTKHASASPQPISLTALVRSASLSSV